MELYGVFMRFNKRSRLCVGSTDNLDVAKAKMREEADRTGVQHYVYDFTLEQIVATSLDGSGLPSKTPE